MSTFTVPVVKIKAIEPIEGADAIELAVIGDYRSVVRKGQYAVGDLAVYIPEQAILPTELIEEMGLTGKLAGSDHNRVKAVKLRGCLSQGILYPVVREYPDGLPYGTGAVMIPGQDDPRFVNEGDNVADDLGITKWNPPVPTYLSGEVYFAGQELTVAYDIENYKKYPTVLKDGEEVVFTEKLHGSFCGVGVLPVKDHDDKHYKREFVVFSKGLGAQGMCFKDVPLNQDNAYLKALEACGMFDKLRDLRNSIEAEDQGGFNYPLFVLGEVYGGGVQDGFSYEGTPKFRMFDIVAGYRGDQHYFNVDAKQHLASHLGIDMVPLLYRGPFSKEVMYQFTDGNETVSGKEVHMREGIVVTPTSERYSMEIGRVILKSVSAAYLTRKGNTTEYQ